jgi:hypothetical protein
MADRRPSTERAPTLTGAPTGRRAPSAAEADFQGHDRFSRASLRGIDVQCSCAAKGRPLVDVVRGGSAVCALVDGAGVSLPRVSGPARGSAQPLPRASPASSRDGQGAETRRARADEHLRGPRTGTSSRSDCCPPTPGAAPTPRWQADSSGACCSGRHAPRVARCRGGRYRAGRGRLCRPAQLLIPPRRKDRGERCVRRIRPRLEPGCAPCSRPKPERLEINHCHRESPARRSIIASLGCPETLHLVRSMPWITRARLRCLMLITMDGRDDQR